jgi:hypothetical protein
MRCLSKMSYRNALPLRVKTYPRSRQSFKYEPYKHGANTETIAALQRAVDALERSAALFPFAPIPDEEQQCPT